MPKLSPAALRALPRRGRLQRAIRRALWAADALPTSSLLEWCYRPPYAAWQRGNVHRSALQFAERAGKRGREVVWRLREEVPSAADDDISMG